MRVWKRIISMLLILVLVLSGVQPTAKSLKAAASITIEYKGKKYTYASNKQSTAKVNKKKLTTGIPGLIDNGVNMVCPTVFKKAGISYSYKSSTKVVTLKYDGTTVKITMGSKYAKVNGKKVTMSTKTTSKRVYYIAKKKYYNMIPARFVFEAFGFTYTWKNASKCCVITGGQPKVTETTVVTPTVKPSKEVAPTESIVPTNAITATPDITAIATEVVSSTATPPAISVTPDPALGIDNSSGTAVATTGPAITPTPFVQPEEMKAAWITYLEFGDSAKTEEAFKKKINKMFDNCASYGMNTVIVQVRPFSDAMYQSDYFPWSKYASGTMGTDPGYDPLAIIVEAAHSRGLMIQAWCNPYRITTGSTDVKKLPKDHPARKWATSDDKEMQRRVLSYSGNLYYNPSSSKVRTLIVNGVKEIVEKYDVDGIHFDDYFYPNLGKNYNTLFDNVEYQAYLKECEDEDTTPKSIIAWRRDNVDTLLKRVHTTVKETDPSCVFGVSPAGNIDNLLSSQSYYCNVKKWMSSDKYMDYICPQIYWSFKNKTCPFAETVDRWGGLLTNDSVRLYVGIAVYRAGSDVEEEWKTSNTVLKRQVKYGRSVEVVSGFMFYRYASFLESRAQKEIENLLPLLQE